MNNNELTICKNCDCAILPGETIFNVEGEDLCEHCAWEQLRKLPKSEILKEFYTFRPSRRRDDDTNEEDGIF